MGEGEKGRREHPNLNQLGEKGRRGEGEKGRRGEGEGRRGEGNTPH
jgi:hypothetical protein